jgi:mono/diheme cytochrome c family protein
MHYLSLALAGSLALTAIGAAQSKADPKSLVNPVSATPKSIATGRDVFRLYCKGCHGADARGEGPDAPRGSEPPNLTDESSAYGSSDGEIYAIIRNGSPMAGSAMKAFKSKLTDDELWSAVNYLQSLRKSGKP